MWQQVTTAVDLMSDEENGDDSERKTGFVDGEPNGIESLWIRLKSFAVVTQNIDKEFLFQQREN